MLKPQSRILKRIVLFLLTCVMAVWICYGLLGEEIIRNIYEEKSIQVLNNLIHGRDIHSVLFYLEMADRIIFKFFAYTTALCIAIMFFVFYEIKKI